MIPFLRFLIRLTNTTKLGADNPFIPLPAYLRLIFNMLPITKQIVTYAKLCNGADLTVIAPNERGCMEALTRVLRSIDTTLISLEVSTIEVFKDIKLNPQRWKDITGYVNKGLTPPAGSIFLCVTKNSWQIGHGGVWDGKYIWNNNSKTGRWVPSYTRDTWYDYFRDNLKLETYIFVPLPINK